MILLNRRILDVMRLGDAEASSLGIRPDRTRKIMVVAASLATAAAVAVSGLISFVGIIVPHTIRLLFGSSKPYCASIVDAFRGIVHDRSGFAWSNSHIAIGDTNWSHNIFLWCPVFYFCSSFQPQVNLMALLEAKNVAVTLGKTRVLGGISLSVKSGEWLTIIGPNGSGKSTFLNALAGLQNYEGSVSVSGNALSKLTARSRAQLVSYVPQHPIVPLDMLAGDYVLLGRTPHISALGVEGKVDLNIVGEILSRLDLEELGSRSMGSLSGGELQRCQLARALAQMTPVILLDEPTAALDLGHQQQALDLLEDLRKERQMTIISTMHDLTLAGQYSDRLMLFDHGTVVADGNAADVIKVELLSGTYSARIRVIEVDGAQVVVPRSKESR